MIKLTKKNVTYILGVHSKLLLNLTPHEKYEKAKILVNQYPGKNFTAMNFVF